MDIYFASTHQTSMSCSSFGTGQSVGGTKTGEPREKKKHLAHLQAELDLIHICPVRGSNPDKTQREDDRMIKRGNGISALLITRPQGLPKLFSRKL